MISQKTRRGAVIGALTAAVLMAGAAPASAAPGDGSAYVAAGTVTLLGVPAVTIPPQAATSTDGPNTAQLAGLGFPGVLNAGLVSSASTRDDSTGVVHSEATLAGVGLTLGNLGTIQAIDVVCDATQAGITGGTTLAGVAIAGVNVPVNPAPNTVIAVPPGPLALVSLTFNEQIANPDGSLTTNGLHVRLLPLLGTGDLVLGSATCGPAAAPVPLASGAGLWIGLGLLGALALPVGLHAVRRRTAAA
ncbi:choice-of-anchor P family protein [Actinokineospora bangkokensis]|uniref:Gram-positive cocci surface proteins LPxTG domain-containing protein n=1 Tax=Actinokineospora bangkokensis TaxID=1193682 RepID=A0A1Q9LBS3_9PSEU|nr:choice-of-anchor P family protein [Actinokineospora bangkokensis]OLR89466.1 hypothetical protein BJP25_05100 [Actinokineospora bangkokensis]